jgi:hypothetical protein
MRAGFEQRDPPLQHGLFPTYHSNPLSRFVLNYFEVKFLRKNLK